MMVGYNIGAFRTVRQKKAGVLEDKTCHRSRIANIIAEELKRVADTAVCWVGCVVVECCMLGRMCSCGELYAG